MAFYQVMVNFLSLQGGDHIVLTFCNPMAVPDEESTFLLFSGSQDQHKVPTSRLNPTSLTASVPGKYRCRILTIIVKIIVNWYTLGAAVSGY